MSNAAADRTDASLESFAAELEAIRERNERLAARVEDLEGDLRRATDRVETLEDETETLRSETAALRSETETLRSENDRLENELETASTSAAVEAAHRRSGANKKRLEELQARELEKGAHLLETNVDSHEIDVDGDALEKIRKDDDRPYYRLPDSEDPLHRGSVSLAYGDLLPIQQLARMDEEMLRSTTNALPSRLAAKLWKARTDPTAGDDPWRSGCKNVREYVKASDLKHWIRRREPGTSDAYAKKLVSRTIDALLDLSKNRLAIRRKRERKNGLEYTERRVLLTGEAEIPGETRGAAAADTEGAAAADTDHDNTDVPSEDYSETETADTPTPKTPDVHGED